MSRTIKCPECRGFGDIVTYLRYGLPSAEENWNTCPRCCGAKRVPACATPDCQSVPDEGETICINCQDKSTKENHDQE